MDLLLLLMVLIWGSNYTIVKSAFDQLPPHAFNAVRMSVASIIFLIAIWIARRVRRRSVFYTPAPITRRDWLSFIGLAVVGHFIYQLCFIGGLSRTSVANSSLILAASPVAIAVLDAIRGVERLGRRHFIGFALSIFGIYLVVGGGSGAEVDSIAGDLLIAGGVICWAIYTVGSDRLMERHSPLGVTGLSMSMGTVLYVATVSPEMRGVNWGAVSSTTWLALLYSATFALAVSYMIWYAAVQKLGGTRTSVYSNLVPLVALAVAVIWRGEPLGARKIIGAALVLVGVGITRAAARTKTAPPQE